MSLVISLFLFPPLVTMSLPTSTTQREKTTPSRVSAFLSAEVEPRHGDMILFTCCLSSGLVDSTIYNGIAPHLKDKDLVHEKC